MKKHTEKQPIDDLFARKLGDMSITPGAKSWDELQHRLGNDRTARIVPVWYRYAAAAACVVLAGGIGWKLYPTNETGKPAVAVITEKANETGITSKPRTATSLPAPDKMPLAVNTGTTLAENESGRQAKKVADKAGTSTEISRQGVIMPQPEVTGIPQPVKGPVPEENKAVAKVSIPVEKLPAAVPETVKPMTVESLKPGITEESVERKLVVVINTPVQTIPKAGEAGGIIQREALSQQENAEDEGLSKASKLFKKLKRIKSGEALAYKGEAGDEEDAGLISRLYGNVRQSLETKKASKQ